VSLLDSKLSIFIYTVSVDIMVGVDGVTLFFLKIKKLTIQIIAINEYIATKIIGYGLFTSQI